MSTASTIYFITGSNRGIGFGLVAHILATHENAFVYAGARIPEKATALIELKERHPNNLSIVKCVAGDTEGNNAIAKEVEERHGRVDTVISNAGICRFAGKVHEIGVDDFNEHLHVNVTGAVVLFQAVYELLKKSPNPRFITVTSLAGSFSLPWIAGPVGSVSYSSSKTALNWVTRKIHFENEWLTAFPLSPGGIDTDMVQENFVTDPTFVDVVGSNMITVEEAAPLLVRLVDQSTRDKEGGQFVHIDGTRIPW